MKQFEESRPLRDPMVESAIHHWAPRFVANGVPLSDFEDVTSGITRWQDWCRAWCLRAARHEQLAHDALAAGCRLSAGEHYTRAAVCYHFGKFLFVHAPEEMREAHLKAVQCRAAALPLVDPPGERVEIPYEGGRLFGVLRKPAGAERPPVVIMCMGLDSAKEEMATNESVFLARGMATLAFDGPGQGEAEYTWPLRGDYEVPVRAVVDWVHARADVDVGRIGLWGVSLGGYYAPRAAAFETRVKACISLSGPYDWAAGWPRYPELTREAFRMRAHCATQADALRVGAALSLDGVAEKITCPLFVVAGRQDRIVPWQDGEKLAHAAAGPVAFLLIDDGNHVENNRVYRYRTQSADWMARQLRLPAA